MSHHYSIITGFFDLERFLKESSGAWIVHVNIIILLFSFASSLVIVNAR